MLEACHSILHYPGIAMARFGQIPMEYGGGNKYRVIWSPSRWVTLTGTDNSMTIQMYCGNTPLEPVGEYWILEGWKAPFEIYAGTKKQWNADPMMLNLGPYPSRGDYVRHATLGVNPADASIEKLISWIEDGPKHRPIENAIACQESLEKDTRDRKRKRRDFIYDVMRPWGGEAFAAAGGGRNTKTINLKYSANELRLPTKGGSAWSKKKSKLVYEIPNAGAM